MSSGGKRDVNMSSGGKRDVNMSSGGKRDVNMSSEGKTSFLISTCHGTMNYSMFLIMQRMLSSSRMKPAVLWIQ